MSPNVRASLTQLFTIAGLAVSTYLAALKFLALPCLGSSGCHAVIHSRFGEIFHVPVGVYSTLLWLAIIYVRDRSKRGVLLVLMAGISAVMMLIQFFILRTVCPYCTLHALLAWTVLWLHAEKPRPWTAPLGLALAAGALALTRQHAETRVATATAHLPAATAAALNAQAAGLYWLGPYTDRSPSLVLSLDCPACLDLLGELTQRSYQGVTAGPAIYFKTTDRNRALTETFVAAVLAQETTPRDAFLAVSTVLLTSKDTALSDPTTAAEHLAGIFPAAHNRRIHAVRILGDHTAALHAAALGDTTPLLLPRDDKPRAFFKIEDLFPAAPAVP